MPPCTWVLRLAHRSAAGAARVAAIGGGVAELVLADLGGHGGVPHRAGGELGGHAHVGAVVLHRLVHGDRPAELDALLGVGGGQLGALEGDAHRLGREQQPVAVDEGLAGARDHRARRAVEGDPRGAAGGVEVLGGVDLHAVAHLDDGDVVAGQHEQHVGEPAAEHGAEVAGGLAVGDRDRAPERRRPRSVDPSARPGQVLGLGGVVGHGVERGAGDHRGHERPGRHGPAELLDHDHELLEPEARAAVLLGEVQTQPARAARGRPRTAAAPRSRPRAGRGRRRGDSRLVRKSDAVSDSARWSSEMAIDMTATYLTVRSRGQAVPLVDIA